MKIYFGMRSTRDIIMRHGVLTAGATWATDRLGFQTSRSNIPIVSMLMAVLPTSRLSSFW